MGRLKQAVNITRPAYACLSGLLLTASFPVMGNGVVAWFALVPLLAALRNLTAFHGFQLGFLTGIVHYLTLLYWFVPFLNTYGPFPMLMSIGVLLLLSAYLAIYVGLFSLTLAYIGMSITTLFLLVPTLWVSLEFVRSFLFSGFPWELLGHTQHNALHIILL